VKADADDPLAIRQADADLLSLALIDARNHTLQWLAHFETHQALSRTEGGVMPLWLAGHAGAYQDRWIARNLQRQRGEAGDGGTPRGPAADARIQAWFDGLAEPPSAAELRLYLARTLDTTLDLLATADPADAALHYFRQALLHEDRLGEALAERAAECQLAAGGLWQAAPARPEREPLWMPAQRLLLGSPAGGAVPDNERWAHEVALPEFEIDAQAVSWARYVEFAEDGGYDRQELWSEAGWAWVQAEGRRAPRHVEQLRGSVLVRRHGQTQRVAAGQAALHVSRHEAEAWCRWAGRRLPAEPEWEAAAAAGAPRGFAWGDVFEWVAGSARAWPGQRSGPGSLDAMPPPGTLAVLRGASWVTRRRCRHPKGRRFALAGSDHLFCGFRSCAI
jgi:formylglycine-generating enzyme required for sulfatase activity